MGRGFCKSYVYTIRDLAKVDSSQIKLILGKRGEWQQKAALGIGSDFVNAERDKGDKTIRKERTFAQPISKPEILMGLAKNMIESLCVRLKQKKLRAGTIAIVYKTKRGEGSHSKSITLEDATNDPDLIFTIVEKLFDHHLMEVPLFLFGDRLSNFKDTDYIQLSLF